MGSDGVRITFVRHGQSEANVSGRWQGQGDAPLSALGKAQAAAVASRLAGVPFDRLISSDLERAHHTALALGQPVEVDPLFREIDVGAWEGRSQVEVAELFPEEVLELRRGAQHVKVGGGESWGEVYERIDRALGALLGRVSGAREVGVFSHGGVLNSLFTGFFDVRGRHPRPLGHLVNTSVSVATVRDGVVELERYNDGSHHPSTARFSAERFGRESAVLAALAVNGEAQSVEFDALEGVREVLAAAREERLARALAERLGAELRVVEEPFAQLLAEARRGERALYLASPEEIGEAAAHAVTPGESSRVRVRPPALGSLSHFVRTPSTAMLGDYSVGGHR